MHREISYVDSLYKQESNAGLYAFTALIGLLIGIDLWSYIAELINAVFDAGLSTRPFILHLFGMPFRFALIAAILGGARILYSSLEGLLSGKVGADLALAIAVVAAIYIREPLVAAEVVFIGMVGECLEAITFARTQRAIQRLAEVCPRMCLVLRDGQEIRTKVEDLRVGERVLVRPGKRVPVDGKVVDGRSAVDQSTLTGESLPVDKGVGDEVFAGTLNQHGALIVEVERIAEHTVVGRVLEMTAQAIREKAPLERTADRLARLFLPAVLSLAVLTYLVFVWWYGFTRGGFYEAVYPAVAVLVVACPCALILATPAAIIAALGRLAGTGVLIKGGAALERLAGVNAFAFDKTGTLTEGRLRLGDVRPLSPGLTEDELLRISAAAESRSEHPLAHLLVAEARQRHLELPPLDDFQAHPGAGVSARIGPQVVLVGNRRFLAEQGIVLPAVVDALLAELDATGQTPLLAARDGEVLGVIGARDEVRWEAAGVIRDLEALGIRPITMLTGDRKGAARQVADRLGLTDVEAELLPADKAAFIDRIRRQGQSIAMVGDGINDAPALAKANVGLALGSVGADVAAEAGDIVLMGDPLRPLPLLVRLARKTTDIIRQNILWFAFAVNGLGILLTAWIMPAWSAEARHSSPLWAAIYHQVGSLAVLLNAMRLLWFERAGDYAIVRGYRRLSEALDRLLGRVSFHDFTHGVEAHWRKLLAGAAATAVLLFLLSGVAIINADEIGIAQRFGRTLPDDLQPGLHYRWPWPFERIHRVKPNELQTVEVGFRTLGTPQTGAQTWLSAHTDGLVRDIEEGMMITGDRGLVEVQASVFFSIRDPRVFLFEVQQPREVVRALAESVLREAIAQRRYADLVLEHREEFRRDVQFRLKQRCEEGYRLGVTVHSVVIQDLHPPTQVLESYYAVPRALSDQIRVILEGRRKAANAIHEQTVWAITNLAQARADHDEALSRAKAEADAQIKLEHAVSVAGMHHLPGFLLPGPAPLSPWGTAAGFVASETYRRDLESVRAAKHQWLLDSLSVLVRNQYRLLRDPRVKARIHVLPDMFRPRIVAPPDQFPPRRPLSEP